MSTTTVTSATVDQVLTNAEESFIQFRKFNKSQRVTFLQTIAEEIRAVGEDLVRIVQEETFLPEARVSGELSRTLFQITSFAQLIERGEWAQATIDTADANRKPLPRPDIRKMLVPVGPVVVFGASNFPLAFSTAGGDTISALASGCSVIVKSHPAHPRTSAIVAAAIQRAIKICQVPAHIFQHIEDSSIHMGQELVKHPHTKSVAFTGSFQGGKALFDIAAQRKNPIPVFAEMGSINPMVILPGAIEQQETLADVVSASIQQGVGQFCTNPGLLIALADERLEKFIQQLGDKFIAASRGKMLHAGIASNYKANMERAVVQKGVAVAGIAPGQEGEAGKGQPVLAVVDSRDFIHNEILREEVFGPFSLLVVCKDTNNMLSVIESLEGQLTSSVFGSKEDLQKSEDIIRSLQQRSGRVIINGVPTGVEVCKAMQHGGPFPSTTDARFTSVGTDAIYRFVRPLSFQNYPEHLLPVELKNENPSGILRCVNNEWTTKSL